MVPASTITKFCLLTNDVENTSIINNRLDDETGSLVSTKGMPLLLDLYSKYNIRATFFFTADIARKHPSIIKLVQPYGHEVGCHGLNHEDKYAFDILPLDTQVAHLTEAKKILEDISGKEVISFRSPALRVNRFTPEALFKTGFKIDSSISSQRFDMFMSLGSTNKLNWVFAPRFPYKTSLTNLAKAGNGHIIEIPISSLIIPYIGTTLRIAPSLIRFLRHILCIETRLSKKPIVFLIHPNEFIDEVKDTKSLNRRSENIISSLLTDSLRSRLKIKNLGEKAIPIYEREIQFFLKHNFHFTTITDYCLLNNFLDV